MASSKVKIGNHTFTEKECGLSKAAATSAAKDIRAKGKMARVKKSGKGHCVLEGPASATIKKRNAAVSGTKRKKTKKK